MSLPIEDHTVCVDVKDDRIGEVWQHSVAAWPAVMHVLEPWQGVELVRLLLGGAVCDRDRMRMAACVETRDPCLWCHKLSLPTSDS